MNRDRNWVFQRLEIRGARWYEGLEERGNAFSGKLDYEPDPYLIIAESVLDPPGSPSFAE